MGKTGRVLVDLTLGISQFASVTAYVYFITSNTQAVLLSMFGIVLSQVKIGTFLVFMLWFFCLERRIERFNGFHAFGDFCIFLFVLFATYFAFSRIAASEVSNMHNVEAINHLHYAESIGFAVFVFEGTGSICPLMDVADNP
mmetsp:Transcript_6506/g.4628  ORF Transcript_6506/g.4628 Transcript_6506/m.4628 type:complete len:142 (-) Transcript_6506:543-968(-)